MPRAMAPEWLAWMREEHIPDVMAAGYFLNFHLQRLLDPMVDPEAATYNVQYECESLTAYDAYQRLAAPALRKQFTDRYGESIVAFRSVLERLEA